MFKIKKYNNSQTFMFGELSKFPEHRHDLYAKYPLSILRKFSLFLTYIAIVGLASCKLPAVSQMPVLKPAPSAYNNSTDTTNSGDINWRTFFNDKNLVALIDTAINNNPDVLMTLQDIEMAKNKVQMRHGALLPSVSVGGGMGVEKVGRYTSQGLAMPQPKLPQVKLFQNF